MDVWLHGRKTSTKYKSDSIRFQPDLYFWERLLVGYLAAMCNGVSPAPFVMVAPARYFINIMEAS